MNLIDAHALFLEWRSASPASARSAPGGTHWNQYGAARVVSQIMSRLEELTGQGPAPHPCTGADVDQPHVVDRTTISADLLNLWRGARSRAPDPSRGGTPGGRSYLPDLLVIGDSFVFTLTNFMDRQRLCAAEHLFYYNRHTSIPEAPNAPLENALDWKPRSRAATPL